MHGQFMSMVNRLLCGEMDISSFEDNTRTLLGHNSYELFTLDKLIHKLIKHMQLMVSDDQTLKLWELYRYEHGRSQPVNNTVYLINCHTVLDDVCYRMEFR